MNHHRFQPLLILTAALGVGGLFAAGCGDKTKVAAVPPAPVPAKSAPLSPPAPAAPVPAAPAAVAVTADAAPIQWSDLKDYGFDRRGTFLAGLAELEARVDSQKADLAAKRATMASSGTNTADWDFAMKEMDDARTFLHSRGEELSKASAESWDQQKELVGQAWVRSQAAYAKVRASTTN